MTINEVLAFEEMQIFDRKSINIEPKTLANSIVAFANADGGILALGISDKTRRIEGVDFEIKKLNELLRVPFDFCEPTVKVGIEKVPCIDYKGRENHIILMHIEPSLEVHANQSDEVYIRIGDRTKKLSFEERTQLIYDKGERHFEDKIVPDATIDDIDIRLVNSYINKINYNKTALEYLKENKSFLQEKNGQIKVSAAAILLFGKKPQLYFPRARVRFIRYEGVEEKFGAEMNVIKDVIFEGTVLKMIKDSITYLDTQIKEKTYLGNDGLFVTEEEYPKFVRQEIIVNAVTHRSYNISGTDIQIKMFDDRIVVESPGKFPGLVRADNIRHTHFSRNPKIAEFLKAYNFVKEYGEGVDRMCKELESIGLKVPEYHLNAFILQTIVYNSNVDNSEDKITKMAISTQKSAIQSKKSAIQSKKSAIHYQKSAIQSQKSTIQPQKISFEMLISAIENKNYKEPTMKNIIRVYKAIDTNQIFGTREIVQILGCSASTAKEIMIKLRKVETVCLIKGKGKGKYRFKNCDEFDKRCQEL